MKKNGFSKMPGPVVLRMLNASDFAIYVLMDSNHVLLAGDWHIGNPKCITSTA